LLCQFLTLPVGQCQARHAAQRGLGGFQWSNRRLVAIYKSITPTGMNPDGKVNVESLAADLAFYKEQGLVEADVKIEQIVDHSFVEVALQQLGPYRKEGLQ
jgi:hypothetical protein